MGQPFPNVFIDSAGNLLAPGVKSPNFISGSSGWSINQNGTAEFNSLVIRNGQIISGIFLLYSSAIPAKGNLVVAFAPQSGGTDAVGNIYPQGYNFGVWDNTGTLKQHFGIDNSGRLYLSDSTGVTRIFADPGIAEFNIYNTAGTGLGNLVASAASAAVANDGFGNAVQSGFTSYSANAFAQLAAAVLNFMLTGDTTQAQIQGGGGGMTLSSGVGSVTGRSIASIELLQSLTAANAPRVLLGSNSSVAALLGFAQGAANPSAAAVAQPSLTWPPGVTHLVEIDPVDGNAYNLQHLTQVLTSNFTINSAANQVIFSVPVGIGTYEVEIWLNTVNSVAADNAIYQFQGPAAAAAPQLLSSISYTGTSPTVTVNQAASAAYTTAFAGQGVGGNQEMIIRMTVAFTAAGTLTFNGKESVSGNTIAISAGSRMTLRPV